MLAIIPQKFSNHIYPSGINMKVNSSDPLRYFSSKLFDTCIFQNNKQETLLKLTPIMRRSTQGKTP